MATKPERHRHPSARRLQRLHPMHAFGVVGGLARRVRFSRLEKRLRPLVPFPHKHGLYHLVIPVKGRGWHEIDFQRYDVAPRTLFVMRPAQVHSWSFAETTAGFVVEFEDEAVAGRQARHPSIDTLLRSRADCLKVTNEDWQSLVALCEVMATEQERQRRDSESILQAGLTALLLLIARNAGSGSEASRGGDFSEAFAKLLEEHYREHHDVGFYAARLGVTSKALTMRIARATGLSVRDVIHERVLLECKRLLAYSDLAIAGVGGEVGFSDPNYFTRFFRRKTGASPAVFRRQARSLC